MADEGVWDSAIKRQNANLIVCMADWIVPGHGQPFRVLAHYRYGSSNIDFWFEHLARSNSLGEPRVQEAVDCLPRLAFPNVVESGFES